MATTSAPSTSGFTANQLSDIIECPICYNVYNRPLQLSCGHTLCSTCIDRLVENARVVPNNNQMVAQPFIPPPPHGRPAPAFHVDMMNNAADMFMHDLQGLGGGMPNNEPIFAGAGGGGPIRGVLPFGPGPMQRNGPMMMVQQRLRQHRRGGGGTEIKCPECRKPTIVPPDGLPVNYRVQDIVAKMASTANAHKSEPQLQQRCKVCDEALNQGVYFDCLTCGEEGAKLCSTCAIRTHNGHDIQEKRAITDDDVKAMKEKINANAGVAFQVMDELQPKLRDLSQAINDNILKILQDNLCCFERMATNFDGRINPSSTIDELEAEVRKSQRLAEIYKEAVDSCDQVLGLRIRQAVEEYLVPIKNSMMEMGIGLFEEEEAVQEVAAVVAAEAAAEVAAAVAEEAAVAAAVAGAPVEQEFPEVQMEVDMGEAPRREDVGGENGDVRNAVQYMMMRDRLRERNRQAGDEREEEVVAQQPQIPQQQQQQIPPPPQPQQNQHQHPQQMHQHPHQQHVQNQPQHQMQHQQHQQPQNPQAMNGFVWNDYPYRARYMRGAAGAPGFGAIHHYMIQQQQHLQQRAMMGIAQPERQQQQQHQQNQQQAQPQQQQAQQQQQMGGQPQGGQVMQNQARFMNPIYNVNYLPNHQGEIVLEMRMRPYPPQQQQQQQQQVQHQNQQVPLAPPPRQQQAQQVQVDQGLAAEQALRAQIRQAINRAPPQHAPVPPRERPPFAVPRNNDIPAAAVLADIVAPAEEAERGGNVAPRNEYEIIINRHTQELRRMQVVEGDRNRNNGEARVEEPQQEAESSDEDEEEEVQQFKTPTASPNFAAGNEQEEEEEDGRTRRLIKKAVRQVPTSSNEPGPSTRRSDRKTAALERAKQLMESITISPARNQRTSTSPVPTKRFRKSEIRDVSDDTPSTSTAPTPSVVDSRPEVVVEENTSGDAGDDESESRELTAARTRPRRSTVYRRLGGRFTSPSGSNSSNTSTETHPQTPRTRSNRTNRDASP